MWTPSFLKFYHRVLQKEDMKKMNLSIKKKNSQKSKKPDANVKGNQTLRGF